MSRCHGLFAALLLLTLSSAASGGSIFGDLRGVTRDASGQPLAQAQVKVHSIEENSDRTAVSGADGSFEIDNLKPGHYRLTASKDGFESPSAATVELAAQQSVHVDVALASLKGSKGSSAPALAASSHGQAVTENAGSAPLSEREKQLLDRIDRLEQRLSAMEAKEVKGASQAAAPSQPLLASLNPSTSLPAEEKSKGLSILPAPTGTPAAAKPAAASPAGAPPALVLPEALSAPEATYWSGQFHPVCLRRLYLVKRHPAQQRHGAGHEILHSGSAIRHSFHGEFQSTEGPHDGRRDGIVPVGRISGGAGQRRR